MNQLSEQSGFGEEEHSISAGAPPLEVYKLSNCEHMMHRACLLTYMKNSAMVSQCVPSLWVVYGGTIGALILCQYAKSQTNNALHSGA